DAFGDVKHYFSNAIGDLESIALDVGQEIQTIVTDVEKNVQSFVLTTVDQMADAMELVFQKIREVVEDAIQVIEEVIQWLEMLLDWDDILNTHQVVKYYINQVLTNLASTVDSNFVTWVQEQFSTLQDAITSAFDNAEQFFGAGTSFNQFANNLPGASGSGNVLAGQTYRDAQTGNAVQCSYVMSKATAYFSSLSGSAVAQGLAAESNAFQTLVQLIQNQVSQFMSSTAQLQCYLKQTASNPQGFFDLAITDF